MKNSTTKGIQEKKKQKQLQFSMYNTNYYNILANKHGNETKEIYVILPIY